MQTTYAPASQARHAFLDPAHVDPEIERLEKGLYIVPSDYHLISRVFSFVEQVPGVESGEDRMGIV